MLVENAEEAKHTGGMVALLPADPGPLVIDHDNAEPAEDIHLTLLFLGSDVTGWSEARVAELHDVLAAVAEERDGPIEAVVGGHATFAPASEEPVAVHLISGDGLAQIRERVVAAATATVGDDLAVNHTPWTAHITGAYGARADALSYAGTVVFDRLLLVLGGERTEWPLLDADGHLVEAVRAAYAVGWARSGGPMTDRVKAGCLAAIEWAREHRDDPHLIEATIDLGSLEGTWAAVFERREALYRRHLEAITAAWRKAIANLDVAAAVKAFCRDIGLAVEAALVGDDDEQAKRQAAAQARAKDLLQGIVEPTAPQYVDLVNAVAAALQDAEAEGTAGTMAILADQAHAGVAFDFDLAFHDAHAALADLGTYWSESQDWIGRMVGGAANDLGAALSRVAADGGTFEELMAAADDVLGDGVPVRALDTLVDMAMSQSFSRGAVSLYGREGVAQVDYVTAGGERVCFPAGTPVAVPGGSTPIERLDEGDVVSTPTGPRRILQASHRLYDGTMVGIRADGKTVCATADHPFWTPRGWREAQDLRVGDQLQTTADVLVKVDGVVHLHLGQPDDSKPAFGELPVPSGVPRGRLGVPVGAIRLKRDAELDEQEVDGPAPDAGFLLERDSEPLQRLAHSGFQSVLTDEPSAAGQAAEGWDAVRHVPEPPPAVSTIRVGGRSAAGLGAEAPVEVLLGAEPFTAPLAVDVLRVAGLAGHRAGGMAEVLGLGDVEGLATGSAGLRDGDVASGFVAVSGAVDALGVDAGIAAGARVERLVAVLADAGREWLTLREAVAALPAVDASEANAAGLPSPSELLSALVACVPEGQEASVRYALATGGDVVYDLTVDDQEVFYAGGFLVHNCPRCLDIEGNNPWQRGEVPQPALHPYCFPAGVIASGPGVRTATDRWYEGDLVEIRTRSGRVLPVTPNHPVLTTDGWVAAGEVVVGAHVVGDTALQSVLAGDPHDHQEPALIEEISDALLRTRGMTSVRVPMTAEDFHGDGSDGEVDVVGPYGLLRDRVEVEQPLGEEKLGGARALPADLLGRRDPRALLGRLAAAAESVVSCPHTSGVLLGSLRGGDQSVGLSGPSDRDPVAVEEAGEGRPADATLVGECLEALSGLVAADEVIAVDRREWAGHVYNLETSGGWYTANGIIVHNCRCVLMPTDPLQGIRSFNLADYLESK